MKIAKDGVAGNFVVWSSAASDSFLQITQAQQKENRQLALADQGRNRFFVLMR